MAVKIFRELDSKTLFEFAAVLALPGPNNVPQSIALLVLVQDDVALARVEVTKLFFGQLNLTLYRLEHAQKWALSRTLVRLSFTIHTFSVPSPSGHGTSSSGRKLRSIVSTLNLFE